jgi:hypothetical protein
MDDCCNTRYHLHRLTPPDRDLEIRLVTTLEVIWLPGQPYLDNAGGTGKGDV